MRRVTWFLERLQSVRELVRDDLRAVKILDDIMAELRAVDDEEPAGAVVEDRGGAFKME